MTVPFVSVIIPTYNRAESLRRTLDSLSTQTYPMDRFEVIVVDDGSSDDTAAIGELEFPFALRCICQANQGAAVARNRGANEARGETLIFLDDDIVAAPQFITGMARATDDHTIVVGTLQPVVRPGASPYERFGGTSVDLQGMDACDDEISFSECLSGIFAVRRDLFFDIGAMQDVAQDGRVAWGDVDFGYRAWKQRYRFLRSGDAIGYHHDFSVQDLRTHSRRWQRAASSAVALFRKYPDLQAHLPMFRDKTPISWRDDAPRLILRKVGRAVTAWRPVLWGMERLAHMLERVAPRPALLRPLYRWIVSSYIYRGYRQGPREHGPVEARS